MKQSAGLLLYRNPGKEIEFFLVHPGGPFFAKKDAGYWTIPKGEPEADEDLLHTAIREFSEETGMQVEGPFIALEPIVQKGGKQVFCWATETDLNPSEIISNTFEIEWPPRSGLLKSFPEIDQADWFSDAEARLRINERQIPFLHEVLSRFQS